MSGRLRWEDANRRDRIKAFHESKPRKVAAGLRPPTEKQVALLKSLADELGRAYVPPRNRIAASDEITRLKKLATARRQYGA